MRNFTNLSSLINEYSGNPVATIAVVIVLCLCLFVIIGMVLKFLLGGGSRGSKLPEGSTFDSFGKVRGRLERVEKTLHDFRTEVIRNLTLSKAEIEVIGKDLAEIKTLLASGRPDVLPQESPPAKIIQSAPTPKPLAAPAQEKQAAPQPSSPSQGNPISPSLVNVSNPTVVIPASVVQQVVGTLPSSVKGAASPPVLEVPTLHAQVESPPVEKTPVLPFGGNKEGSVPSTMRDTVVIQPRPATAKGVVSVPGEVERPGKVEGGIDSLSLRLQKTRRGILGKIKKVFGTKPELDESMLEHLEAHLIFADLGIQTVAPLMEELRERVASGNTVTERDLKGLLKASITEILEDNVEGDLRIIPARKSDGPMVVLMVGVNGSGKTTTTAKLAASWKSMGLRVMMVAADTFRAAAVEQLCYWGKELDLPVVYGESEVKPSTVVFDSMERARKEDIDVLIIDTAGRLHTKSNLMQELEGIQNVIKKHQPDAPHETLLVVDGSTGQNAVNQAIEFNSAVPLTGLVVTKLDGTPKGGVVVAIKSEIGTPVKYIGVGEGQSDLRFFDITEFVNALFETADTGA